LGIALLMPPKEYKDFYKMLAIYTLIISALALPAAEYIPNQYIVVFKPHVKDTKAALDKYLADLQVTDRASVDNAVVQRYKAFKGAAIRLPDSFVGSPDEMRSVNEDIAYIEQDQIYHAFGTQTSPPWGLARISSKNKPASGASYTYPDSAGTGVDAYVIDTGIYVQHPAFQGRAKWGADFTGQGQSDGNGHGTHVAGTIGSSLYGVAKNVNLIAVRVLDSQGSGSLSNVIAGIDWVVKNKRAGLKSVANMSLGGGASTAIDDAVKAAVNAGVVMVVAAGNSAGDACNFSPARVPTAITVASSDVNDKLASSSEKGKCVSIIAPGVGILSTWNNGQTNTISGTSMAAPHVAGIVALALAERSFANVAAVKSFITSIATPNKITGTLNGAPNLVAYNKF
ncbi:hypothetical protein HDV02_003636, partial [Globomyces sp. JEL0801]